MRVVSTDLLRRLDLAGPRYTSYPAADHFVEAFRAKEYLQALVQRRDLTAALALPLSLYVHIPFCESLCYFCACNKIVTKQHSAATTYLRYLSREVDLLRAHFDERQKVSQLRLGGGTPTFLSDDDLRCLMSMLRRSFQLLPGGEYVIEIDPRAVDTTRLAALAELGFNRLSFGVQDFDPAVQKAVHRWQPAEHVFKLMAAARQLGFESVNLDLIYGLPLQTPETFDRTLAQLALLQADQVTLHAYAHLPERFKPQRHIAQAELPSRLAQLEMRSRGAVALQAAGYVFLGMDHFALPTDELAVAKRQGRLHRNFQGYSNQPAADLVALGVSAMGRMGTTYSQNATSLAEYYDLLDQGCLPVVRGLAVSRDDLLRRAVIMALVCQGVLLYESIEQAFLIDFRSYFAQALEALQALQVQGWVVVHGQGIEVTSQGWFFVSEVAMVFDRYWQADRKRSQFSKII